MADVMRLVTILAAAISLAVAAGALYDYARFWREIRDRDTKIHGGLLPTHVTLVTASYVFLVTATIADRASHLGQAGFEWQLWPALLGATLGLLAMATVAYHERLKVHHYRRMQDG